MGSSEKFCLRWNDFHSNISAAFKELRDDNDFFDVTLACPVEIENGKINDKVPSTRHKTVKAHKVILSACSVFFKDLLKSMGTQGGTPSQPYIYLRGIKYDDLKAILDFMYYGQVNIAQNDLNAFLAVAEELRVKGLSPNETGSGQTNESFESPSPLKRPAHNFSGKSLSNFQPKKPKLVKKTTEELVEVKTELSEGALGSKSEQFSTGEGTSSGTQFGYVDDFTGNEDYLDDGASPADQSSDGNKAWRDLQMEQLESGFWRCGVCSQEVQYRHSLQRHIESKHMHCEPIQCPYCEKSFNTKNSIQTHISKYHRNIQRL